MKVTKDLDLWTLNFVFFVTFVVKFFCTIQQLKLI